MGKHECVISISVTISAAKVLLERGELLGKMKGHVRRAKALSTFEIPDVARKGIEYQNSYDMERARELKYSSYLIVKVDQRPSKLVSVGRSTLAKRNSTIVTIAFSSDERTITAVFGTVRALSTSSVDFW